MDDTARAAGGKLGEYAYTGRLDRPMAEVVKDIIGNVQDMVRSEVRLAKAELREEAAKTMSAAKKLVIGAGAGLFALGFVLTSGAQLLATVLAPWLATLLVGIVLGIVAAVMLSSARGQLRVPKPEKTIENVKENVEWMKSQTR
jgi:uncharacterized membrane protein YqjE